MPLDFGLQRLTSIQTARAWRLLGGVDPVHYLLRAQYLRDATG